MAHPPASHPSRRCRADLVPTLLSGVRRGWAVWLAVAMLLAAAPAHAQTGNSSAFGVQATGSVTGGSIVFGSMTLGPTPTASGSAPPAYNVTNTQASASGSLSITSPSAQTVSSVSTALMQVNAQSPAVPDPIASSTVNNASYGTNAFPTGIPQSILGINATSVQSTADIGGTCGALTPVGTTTITNGVLSGSIQSILGLSATIVSNPPPNFVLLDVTAVSGALGSGRIRVVLNEQIVTGNGTTNLSLTVNAIHITISGATIPGVPGTVNQDVIFAQSRAALNCPLSSPQADLSILMTDSPDPVSPPGTITYQITVTNNGPANVPLAQVTVDLPLGPNVTLGTVTPSQGSCGVSDPLVCNLGVLNAGATATITVTVNVTPGAPSPLVNIATVVDASGVTTDPNPANNTATTSTTVAAGAAGSADLSIVKTGTPNPVTGGQSVTYVLTITNNGPSAATNVVVSDPVPLGAVLQSATPSAGGNCTTGAVVTCTFASLAAGATATVVIIVTAPSTPGILTNTAVVSSSVADPNPGNNSSTTNTTVVAPGGPATADLSVIKTANPNPVLPGGTVTYLITVTNNGPSAATNVIVSDPVPVGATLQTATPSAGGSCTTGAVVTCTFPSLAASASATVTIVVTAPPQPGSLTNTVVVSSSVPDPNPANNTATTVTQVGGGPASADLAVTKTASPNVVTPSGTLTYLITVTNNGPNAATSVVVSDTLPAGVVLVSATPSAGGSCGTGNPVVCTFPVLAAGTAATVTIVVTAPASGGPLVNTVTVSSAVSDPNPGNNTATTTTPISSAGTGLSANLQILKSASPNPVAPGAQLTYLLTATNLGPDTATNVVVTDQLPPGVSPVSAVASGGGVCTLGTTVTCTFASLASGASVTVTIVVTAPAQSGTLLNTATVSSAVNDPDPSNNIVFVVTQVVGAAPGAAPIPTLSEWAMILLVSLIVGFAVRELQRRRRSPGGPAAA